ncbi:hypothetical protein M9458_011991, partial [Cirrhinus mrigala]
MCTYHIHGFEKAPKGSKAPRGGSKGEPRLPERGNAQADPQGEGSIATPSRQLASASCLKYCHGADTPNQRERPVRWGRLQTPERQEEYPTRPGMTCSKKNPPVERGASSCPGSRESTVWLCRKQQRPPALGGYILAGPRATTNPGSLVLARPAEPREQGPRPYPV